MDTRTLTEAYNLILKKPLKEGLDAQGYPPDFATWITQHSEELQFLLGYLPRTQMYNEELTLETLLTEMLNEVLPLWVKEAKNNPNPES